VLVLFGLIGYAFRKLECEPAPMLLGMVLGPMMEEYLRRSLLLSRGDPTVFLTRPLSATLLALAVVAIVAVALPHVRRRRDAALEE
jgi:putative tricarboxylic transport membrane protein